MPNIPVSRESIPTVSPIYKKIIGGTLLFMLLLLGLILTGAYVQPFYDDSQFVSDITVEDNDITVEKNSGKITQIIVNPNVTTKWKGMPQEVDQLKTTWQVTVENQTKVYGQVTHNTTNQTTDGQKFIDMWGLYLINDGNYKFNSSVFNSQTKQTKTITVAVLIKGQTSSGKDIPGAREIETVTFEYTVSQGEASVSNIKTSDMDDRCFDPQSFKQRVLCGWGM